MIRRIVVAVLLLAYFTAWSLFLRGSTLPPGDQHERIRSYTRTGEFDYLGWTIQASWEKLTAASVGLPHRLPTARQSAVVVDYLDETAHVIELERSFEAALAAAPISGKSDSASQTRVALRAAQQRQAELAPLAEAVLQARLSDVLAEFGLTVAGQPVPAVLYQTTPLPLALIVSPRDHIEQLANISIDAGLDLDATAALEDRIDADLDVSSLVVPIGGVGVYPTMVVRSTDLPWLLETIAHEWTHNFLTLRPLGALYDATPELRTMNETAASIAGTEIAARLMEKLTPPEPGLGTPTGTGEPATISPKVTSPPTFDFRQEMHATRVRTDQLLAAGRVEEAEAYMEARRVVFMEHGYVLRKLNQAYFAFYGAYADIPGGEAGEDPVGAAVRELRGRSSSLSEFLNGISWLTSFEDLQRRLGSETD